MLSTHGTPCPEGMGGVPRYTPTLLDGQHPRPRPIERRICEPAPLAFYCGVKKLRWNLVITTSVTIPPLNPVTTSALRCNGEEEVMLLVFRQNQGPSVEILTLANSRDTSF